MCSGVVLVHLMTTWNLGTNHSFPLQTFFLMHPCKHFCRTIPSSLQFFFDLFNHVLAKKRRPTNRKENCLQSVAWIWNVHLCYWKAQYFKQFFEVYFAWFYLCTWSIWRSNVLLMFISNIDFNAIIVGVPIWSNKNVDFNRTLYLA